MQAIKSLLAISVLAAAGAAHSATVGTFNVSIGGTVNDYSTGSPVLIGGYTGGSGTATLDDSGLLTIHMTGFTQSVTVFNHNVVSVLDVTSTFQGSYSGGTFTISEDAGITGSNAGGGSLGTETATNCTGSCDVPLLISALNTSHPYDFGSNGTVTLAGGSIDAQELAAGAYLYDRVFTLTPTAPSVPVPAAAWLFGSGLLGLAGTARRRTV